MSFDKKIFYKKIVDKKYLMCYMYNRLKKRQGEKKWKVVKNSKQTQQEIT